MDYHSPVSIVNFRSPTSPIMYKLTFCTLLFKKAGNFVVTHQPVQRQVHLFLFFITRVSETSPRLIPWIHAVPQSHMHRVITKPNSLRGSHKGIRSHRESNSKLTLPEVHITAHLTTRLLPWG